MSTKAEATIEDLYRVPENGKAEIVNGELAVYRAGDPGNPTMYRRGEVAEAEPAVPGWSMAVDDLFT